MKQLFVNSMLFMFFVLYLGISYGTLEERREERLVSDETTASTMSHLEGIINNQVAERSGQQNYGIELFIVIDYSIYHKWYVLSSKKTKKDKKKDTIQNIKYFYTHIVNGINERYKTINEPDMKFYVKCVGYFIAQTPEDAPFTEKRGIKYKSDSIDADLAIKEFSVWVENMSKSPVNPLPKFDSAALFTSYKMYSGSVYLWGYGQMRQTCYLQGVSITTDHLEYATIQTGAHEIAHNLGSEHDGHTTRDRSQDDIGHRCNPLSQFIMSIVPKTLTNETFPNSYKFSSCSVAYFRKYIAQLDRLNNNCLKNVAHDEDPRRTSLYLQSYPGQKFSVDMQCRLLYGHLSYFCTGRDNENANICRWLACYNPEVDHCQVHPKFRAFQGTHCGKKKWCIKSACVYDSRAKANGKCIHGDFRGIYQVGEKKAKCVRHIKENPSLCYNEQTREHCCASCSKIEKKTVVGCEYGDKALWCNEFNFKNAHQCYLNKDKCCQTCARLLTKVPGCEYGDKKIGCKRNFCSSLAYKADCCYPCRSSILPVTKTPPTTRRRFPKKCPKGDIVGWCKTMHPSQCYRSNNVCCETCLQYFDARKPEACKYGDREVWCLKLPKNAKECRTEHVAKSCCHSCKRHTPKGLVDKASWCKKIKLIRNCYKHKFKRMCAATCSKHRINGAKPNCKYGDLYSWCNKNYCSTKKKECCASCA